MINGKTKSMVFVIQHNNMTYTEFLLNTCYNKNDSLQKIEKLHYKEGGTKTGQRLLFILENHLVASADSQKEACPEPFSVSTLLTG